MADNIKIEVKGLRELGEALKALGKETSQKIARSMTNGAAQLVRKAAVSLAPIHDSAHFLQLDEGGEKILVYPGNLKKAIAVRRIAKTDLTSEHIVFVRGKRQDGYAARYGRLVEYGTVKMGARPFLRPALANNIDAAAREMKRKGEAGIKRAIKQKAKGAA